MGYHFKNLVFEGGGIKGIAYVGALEVLESEGILKNIKRVGGTSAGAIIALLVGLGYTVTEIRDELANLDFKDFLDNDIGIIRNLYRLFFNGYGWFKGNAFLKWIESIIYKKTNNKNSTFKDIKSNPEFKDMFFQGTNLSTHLVATFSTEDKFCENMPIKDAIRISMSIPLIFKSIKKDHYYYVDGGVLSNYPIRLFDSIKYVHDAQHYLIPSYYKKFKKQKENIIYVYNKETLGFRLVNKEKLDIFTDTAIPKNHKISSFFNFSWNLIATLMENQENTYLTQQDKDRTIFIDSFNVSTVDFYIDSDTKQNLISSGKISTEMYIKNYNNDKNTLLRYNKETLRSNIIIN
ncbi:patatin-like phospholipase family protein [Clostridium senegalense]|uniref:patatin-like phospholipase family protein n=1 Tax=Clostridium senegalense TaxID=1465809 RepID=UPI001C115539|nr:patatin-like phospholipase family protein [Clostridium senegalense]MBU5228255.1 patatin-like phospholipase family protein [Clostridium senegalense]